MLKKFLLLICATLSTLYFAQNYRMRADVVVFEYNDKSSSPAETERLIVINGNDKTMKLYGNNGENEIYYMTKGNPKTGNQIFNVDCIDTKDRRCAVYIRKIDDRYFLYIRYENFAMIFHVVFLE